MKLFLWRHAEAEDGSPDLARPLTSRGRQQAAVVGNWLRLQVPGHTAILVSPAKRTRQTADALGLPYEIDERIAPGAQANHVLTLIEDAALVEQDPVLIVVGHQPWLGQLAALLLSGRDSYWSVRKGACWCLQQRSRDAETRWTLRSVIDADTLKPSIDQTSLS